MDGITESMDMSLGRLQEFWWIGRPGVLHFMGSQRVRHDCAAELNWTENDYDIDIKNYENIEFNKEVGTYREKKYKKI